MEYNEIGEAENGCDALKTISFLKLDVVLINIEMPYMNGLELMRMLNRYYSNIGTVIINGCSEFEYTKKRLEHGAFTYILQPADDDTFSDTFRQPHSNQDTKRENTILKIRRGQKGGNDSNLYKENIVFNILENRCNKTVLKNNIKYLHKAGYKIHNQYGVMVFQVGSIKKVINAEKLSPINIELSTYIIQKVLVSLKSFNDLNCKEILYNKNNYTFMLILSSPTVLSRYNSLCVAKHIRTVIMNNLDMEMDVKLCISIGIGHFYNLNKLAVSYEEAKVALRNKFFKGCGTINHVDECIFYNKNKVLSHSKGDKNNREYEASRKIVDILFQNREINIRGVLNHYFAMDKINHLSPEKLYRKVIELISLIFAGLYDKGINIKETEEDSIYDNIKEIINTQSVTQLIDCMEDMLKTFNSNILIQLESIENKNEQFENLLCYIENNLDKRISLGELAEKCFYSPQYFSKWFKNKTGLTFKEYHTHVRIKKAKELLERTNLKIYDVAMMVGYDDYRYFSRIFKKSVGYSPSKYKSEIIG